MMQEGINMKVFYETLYAISISLTLVRSMLPRRKKHTLTLIHRVGELAWHEYCLQSNWIFLCIPSCIKLEMYQFSLYKNKQYENSNV